MECSRMVRSDERPGGKRQRMDYDEMDDEDDRDIRPKRSRSLVIQYYVHSITWFQDTCVDGGDAVNRDEKPRGEDRGNE